MQFKPIAAIIVLLLVVASLLVAGCTTFIAGINGLPYLLDFMGVDA